MSVSKCSNENKNDYLKYKSKTYYLIFGWKQNGIAILYKRFEIRVCSRNVWAFDFTWQTIIENKLATN